MDAVSHRGGLAEVKRSDQPWEPQSQEDVENVATHRICYRHLGESRDGSGRVESVYVGDCLVLQVFLSFARHFQKQHFQTSTVAMRVVRSVTGKYDFLCKYDLYKRER